MTYQCLSWIGCLWHERLPACLFSDLIIPCLVPLLERNRNNLWSAAAALFHLFIDTGLLSAHRANFNGHEVQFRGFSLVGEKIDRRFPVGFHRLLLGYMRPSDTIGFQSVKVWLQKWLICWLDIPAYPYTVHCSCYWSLYAYIFHISITGLGKVAPILAIQYK